MFFIAWFLVILSSYGKIGGVMRDISEKEAVGRR